MIVHILMGNINDKRENLEPHMIGIHKRGSYHYVYGGETGAALFRVSEEMLETMLFTKPLEAI